MWALPGDLSLVTAGSNLAYTLSLDVLFCLPWCNPDRDLPDLFFSLQNIPLLHKTLLQSVFKLWEDGGSSYYCNVNTECLVFAFLGARFGSVFLYISFPFNLSPLLLTENVRLHPRSLWSQPQGQLSTFLHSHEYSLPIQGPVCCGPNPVSFPGMRVYLELC